MSACTYSGTDKVMIDKEIQDNTPVYRFIAVKPRAKADAAGTVNAMESKQDQ